MRKLPLLLFLALCLQIAPAISQNQAFKNAIHAKLNFIDYGLLYDNEPKLGQGFEFAYFRNIAPALNVGIPFKLGLAKLPGSTDGNTVTAGADLQFRLENMKSTAKVIPFALGGAGFVAEKGDVHVQFPFGAGLHFRLSPYAFINLQGEFRKALVDDRDNLQVGIGYVYLLHKAENKVVPEDLTRYDQDRDGTPDSLDVCPTVAGPPTALGCPDADSDGFGDNEDPCPNDAGPAETSGCPDYDSDGVADKDDECPTEAGALKGCPDADYDGVADKNDKCPNEKGTEVNMGCPEKKDADGDGVPDEEDLCPDKAGANRGCPDTDGDGIADNYDVCPDFVGTIENNGCPDTDGDGVADKSDQCPDMAGPKSNNGCPEAKDTDGDGVIDEKDPCPTQAGPVNGCPESKDPDTDGDGIPDKIDPCPKKAGDFGGCPDTDGDGVADNLDKCPNQAGTSNNFGCPEEKKNAPAPPVTKPVVEEKKEIKEVREKLATAARAVQFETAKAILKDASYDVLDEVVTIMRQNLSYSLSISGYTDDIGDDEENLKLSQDRTKACYDYFLFRGIKAERIRYAGFGEARPIASNENEKGREQNRRVEFELILE
jgi:OOP family OmpA-OmpF porin